jgi:hypothetical protein
MWLARAPPGRRKSLAKPKTSTGFQPANTMVVFHTCVSMWSTKCAWTKTASFLTCAGPSQQIAAEIYGSAAATDTEVRPSAQRRRGHHLPPRRPRRGGLCCPSYPREHSAPMCCALTKTGQAVRAGGPNPILRRDGSPDDRPGIVRETGELNQVRIAEARPRRRLAPRTHGDRSGAGARWKAPL